MTTRLSSRIIGLAALLSMLFAVLVAGASQSLASPLKSGAAQGKPAQPQQTGPKGRDRVNYGLLGDATNTGFSSTIFTTTNTSGDSFYGWSFGDSQPGDTTLRAYGASTGLYAEGTGVGVSAYNLSNGYGLYAYSTDGLGIYTYGGEFGVKAESNGDGVHAQTFGLGGSGVQGITNVSPGVSYAVRGRSDGGSSSYGGYFSATLGVGLFGASTSGNAVYGKSGSGYGVLGVSASNYGVYGRTSSSYAVVGVSDGSIGVRGVSTDYYGFYAGSTNGVGGYAYTANGTTAFRAKNNTPNTAGHYAIIADGNLLVNGNISCTGSCLAAMGVKTDSGNKLVYLEGATQNRLSDAGTATLKNGRVVIKIDPTFAQMVNLSGDYQVFLTPQSADTLGIAAVNLSANSFEVRELNKGTGNFKFSWRVEAARKGFESLRMPTAPVAPAADVVSDKLDGK